MSARSKSDTELSRLLALVRPFFEKYGNQLILALAAVLLVRAAWTWWSRSSTVEAAAGWADMLGARQAEDFADVADQFPGTPVAAWARLGEGDGYLQRAVELSFTDRKASAGALKKSRDAYDRLLNKRATPGPVRERALFGVARLEESVAGEDVSKAVAAWKKLLEEFPETVYKDMAAERIATLEDEHSRDFYAWFAKQEPSLADDLLTPDDLPASPTPGDVQTPGQSTIVPEAPMLNLPGLQPNTDSRSPPPADAGKSDAANTDAGKSDPARTKADEPAAPNKSDAASEKTDAGQAEPATGAGSAEPAKADKSNADSDAGKSDSAGTDGSEKK